MFKRKGLDFNLMAHEIALRTNEMPSLKVSPVIAQGITSGPPRTDIAVLVGTFLNYQISIPMMSGPSHVMIWEQN